MPLFLATACEELRLQAEYGLAGDGVTKFISSLPDDVSKLMEVVLARVEYDMADWLANIQIPFPAWAYDEYRAARRLEKRRARKSKAVLTVSCTLDVAYHTIT